MNCSADTLPCVFAAQSAMTAGAARSKEDFKSDFPGLEQINSANLKKKSQRFLRAVIEKFGTAEQVLTAGVATKTMLGASAWA
jgi:hypothetical protein